MMKVGIMGGTFNPVHIGHLVLAQRAADFLKLDKVLFIPSGNPRYKGSNGILSSELRIKMIEESISDNDLFVISDIDVMRDGYTYTVDTLRQLHAINDDSEYYFIMGADSLFTLTKWHKFEDIFPMCTIVAARRPGEDNDSLKKHADEIAHKYSAKIELIDMPLLEVSSTDIRTSFIHGESYRYLVPEPAYRIIENNRDEILKIWNG